MPYPHRPPARASWNCLGRRQPEHHGRTSAAELDALCRSTAGRIRKHHRRQNLSTLAVGVVQGFGIDSYLLALDGMYRLLTRP